MSNRLVQDMTRDTINTWTDCGYKLIAEVHDACCVTELAF